MRRTSRRIESLVGDRPTEWRYLKVQRRLTRSACPRNTVAGVMSMPTHRALGSIRINAAINARSAHDKRGRGMVTPQHR